MRVPVHVYVLATTAAALTMVVALQQLVVAPSTGTLQGSVGFVLVGLVCQVYMYQKYRTAAGGTISFIPFLTAAVVEPDWRTPVLVAAAVSVGELVRRPGFLKGLFNVSQYTFAIAASIAAFAALGGHSLHLDERFRAGSYAALLVVFLASNTLLVSGVVSIASGQKWFETWRRQSASMVRYDLLASPLIYIFALVFNRFALAGIVFVGVLLLGVRQLYSTNWRLQETNRELLEVMVAAIELRDPYTSGHSQRVAEYSTTIARAIGLSRQRVERVRVAALLHDVGKIDQRFAAILQKPGRLTDEERATIELHPVISAELVSRVSGLADVVASVRHHHERWDGKGYPDRIAGEAIPLFARIITFADTIDAMTTDRPYRRALGPAEVRAELLRNRERQFDPTICDRLLASPAFQELFDSAPASSSTASKTLPIAAA